MTCDVTKLPSYPHSPLYLQITFDGTQHGWNLDEMGPAYPLFVNEAAYYEKGVALVLARKMKVEVRRRRVWFHACVLVV